MVCVMLNFKKQMYGKRKAHKHIQGKFLLNSECLPQENMTGETQNTGRKCARTHDTWRLFIRPPLRSCEGTVPGTRIISWYQLTQVG